MIVIDHQDEIKAYLTKINQDLGVVYLDQITMEQAIINPYEIYFVHEKILESDSASQVLEDVDTLLLYGNKESDYKNLNIISRIHTEDKDKYFPVLLKLLKNLNSDNEFLRSELIKMNALLNISLKSVEDETQRVKNLYRKLIPRRKFSSKGINILSRFLSGTKPGGEFFDVINLKNEAYLFFISVNSYLASSCLISLYTDFKAKEDLSLDSIDNFLKIIDQEMSVLNESAPVKVELKIMSLKIDLLARQSQGHLFGSFNILSSDDNNIMGNNNSFTYSERENNEVDFLLPEEERLLILSPGLMGSLASKNLDLPFASYLKDKDMESVDLVDEIFFRLKKDQKETFSDFDASALCMEINKNVFS